MYCVSQNTKLRIQEADIDKACNVSRELFASKSKDIFDEFHTLKRNLAYRYVEASLNFRWRILFFTGCSTQIGQLFSVSNLLLSWQTRGKAFAIRLNFVEYLIICVSFIKHVLEQLMRKILSRWGACKQSSPVEEIHGKLWQPCWTEFGKLRHVFQVNHE